MSMCDWPRLSIVLVSLLASTKAWTVEGPNLGVPLSAAESRAIDITITSDGHNLPPGQGSVARGAELYTEQCLSCHGADGSGGVGNIPRLTGGIGTLADAQPVKTVNSFWPYAPLVFDYIRRTMPPHAPQSLSNDDVYAVTAYLLSVDKLIAAEAKLGAEGLRAVRMPNRDGFISGEEWKAPR